MSDDDAVPAMRDALLDDLRRQNLALKAALLEAADMTGRCCCMHWSVREKLRRKWANLIGEEL